MYLDPIHALFMPISGISGDRLVGIDHDITVLEHFARWRGEGASDLSANLITRFSSSYIALADAFHCSKTLSET